MKLTRILKTDSKSGTKLFLAALTASLGLGLNAQAATVVMSLGNSGFTAAGGEAMISTNGTFHSALNIGGNTGTDDVIVGAETITFTSNTDLFANASFDVTNVGSTGAWANVLGRARFSNAGNSTPSEMITIGNGIQGNTALTIGLIYEVEFFYGDTRTCCDTRTQDISGDSTFADSVNIGVDTSAIGTFTADATTQDFFIARGTNLDTALVAISVRVIPEPSAVAFGSLALFGCLLRRRRQ